MSSLGRKLMTSPDTDTTKSEGKRKKDSSPSFLLEANFLRDPKVRRLRLRHGLEGAMVWLGIVCDLRLSDLSLHRDFLEDFATEFNISSDLLEQIVNTCLTLNLLQLHDGSIVTCEALSSRINEYHRISNARREAGRKSGESRRLKSNNFVEQPVRTKKKFCSTTLTKLNKTKLNVTEPKEIDPNLICVRPKVILHINELSGFQAEIPPAELEYWLNTLQDYADANPAKFKKYANHAAVLRSWRRKRLEEGYTWDGVGFSKKSPFKPEVKKPDQSGIDFINRLADEERRQGGISD